MKKEEILTYYDDLYRLALSKCADRFEAEDLVQDTVLAALNFLAGGGEIEHPKSWLASTLMHKFNSMLRNRYKSPTILQYEGLKAVAAEEEPDFLSVGGLRTHQVQSEDGKTRMTLYEYDTAYSDSPGRYNFYKGGGFMGYGVQLLKLLWCTKSGKSPEEEGVSERMLESIPGFIKVGILAKDDSGKLIADIPLLEVDTESRKVEDCIEEAVQQLIKQSGEDLTAFVKSTLLPIPGHLKSVPDFLRASISHLVMAYVYIAINRGVHLNDIDFICPPVIMTYGAIE